MKDPNKPEDGLCSVNFSSCEQESTTVYTVVKAAKGSSREP